MTYTITIQNEKNQDIYRKYSEKFFEKDYSEIGEQIADMADVLNKSDGEVSDIEICDLIEDQQQRWGEK